MVALIELSPRRRSIHETQLVLAPPLKTPTPYGGRLTWTLPGGNLLYVHMKDINKIRNKKRWSQVCRTHPPQETNNIKQSGTHPPQETNNIKQNSFELMNFKLSVQSSIAEIGVPFL